MYISLNWLQQYLPTIDQIDAKEVAERLSNSLAEVESIKRVGENINNIVVGEIISTEPHPKSDELQICQVKISETENRQIIHGGGLEIKSGDKIPVCLPGGNVLNPKDPFGKQRKLEIKEIEIKSINSQGILCSVKELGLYDEHIKVMLLDPNSLVGEKLDYIIKDTILEIENKSLTHRPDAFSHLGIAREIAASFQLTLEENHTLQENLLPTEKLEIEVDYKVDPDRCPRFTAIVVKNIEIDNSPFWLQARLAYTGMRPLNNIIDMSNYVMLDIGQPSHIFDYDKINGHKIVVRLTKEGESIEAIDNKIYKLDKGSVILSDTKSPIGIPGIMGGKTSEITDQTHNMILVVENWNMYDIRRTSRSLGLRSEASTRFEKGLTPANVDKTNKYIANNIIDLAGGEVASELIDIYPNPIENKILEFDLNSVIKILGIELTKQKIISILEALNIQVIGDEKIEGSNLSAIDESNKISLKIPIYRQDLNIKEDIVEEIARVYSYNKLPITIPNRKITPSKSNREFIALSKIKSLLAAYGLNEVYTYSMIGQNLIKKAELKVKDHLEIKNPLSPELQYLRHSISPSLLDKLNLNINNKFDDFGVFEISRVIQPWEKQPSEEKLPFQPFRLAVVYYSSKNPTFEIIKGIYDKLLIDLELPNFVIRNLNGGKMFRLENVFHPSQTAAISLENVDVALVGNIHPLVKSNFEISGNVSIMEFDLTSFINQPPNIQSKITASEYPAVYRDLSFWIKTDIEVGKILDKIKNSEIPYIEKIQLADIYDQKDKSRKSITISLTFRSKKNTLNNNEIKESISQIEKLMENSFKAKLRS